MHLAKLERQAVVFDDEPEVVSVNGAERRHPNCKQAHIVSKSCTKLYIDELDVLPTTQKSAVKIWSQISTKYACRPATDIHPMRKSTQAAPQNVMRHA